MPVEVRPRFSRCYTYRTPLISKKFLSSSKENPPDWNAYLVDAAADPVDARVTADGLVLGVNQDDLVVLVGRVLVDPVGVQNAQVGALAADTLLSGRPESTLVLELVDTHVRGFT